MHRGIEVGIHLRDGLPDENFIATALGNLAAYDLQSLRREALEWQILRVEGSPGQHHFRLIIRHPERVLDIGLGQDLAKVLDSLSNETQEELARRLSVAETKGLKRVPLRHVHEAVDYWRDDFWNWFG